MPRALRWSHGGDLRVSWYHPCRVSLYSIRRVRRHNPRCVNYAFLIRLIDETAIDKIWKKQVLSYGVSLFCPKDAGWNCGLAWDSASSAEVSITICLSLPVTYKLIEDKTS